MEQHEHCQGCVKSSCTLNPQCPVEYCPTGCGFSLHRCKKSEHDKYTCPEARMSCPYGCKELLARKNLGPHIEHCPASTLQCRFAHSRHVAAATVVAAEDPNPHYRKETFIDEKLLEGDMCLILEDSVTPLWLENSIENCPYTAVVYKNSPTHGMSRRGRFCHTFKSKEYLFCCNEIIRRDEFMQHWNRFHIEIQLGLTEVVQRCPLVKYGCTHGRKNLVPSPLGTTLNYDKERDCFLATLPSSVGSYYDVANSSSKESEYTANIQKKKELAMYGYGEEEEESYDVLGQLPFEVLLHICECLDSVSLWSMSLVNHYIRSVSFHVVKKKGIVFSRWIKREDSYGWISSPAVWSFSKVSDNISSWLYTDAPSMAAHMACCNVYKSIPKSCEFSKEEKKKLLGLSELK